MRPPTPDLRTLALAAVLLLEARVRQSTNVSNPVLNWSSTGVAIWPLRLTVGDVRHAVSITAVGTSGYLVLLGKEMVEVAIEDRRDGAVRFTVFGVQRTARFILHEGVLYLDLDGTSVAVRETALGAGGLERRDGSARLLAPMNGAIVGVLAKPGDRVNKGQRIVVLEAMKMQHEISAEREGMIDKILVKPGDQVATRQLLVELAPEASVASDRNEETA
jgi:geranyl-CoA carboxylase alpha subunit